MWTLKENPTLACKPAKTTASICRYAAIEPNCSDMGFNTLYCKNYPVRLSPQIEATLRMGRKW